MSAVATRPLQELNTGDTFDGYKVRTVLSRTAVGTVFAAHDLATNQDLIIKHAFTPERDATLKREAHILTTITHPNMSELIRVGENEAGVYLVLAATPGTSLEQVLQNGPQSGENDIRSLLERLAATLDAVHAAGCIHRDIKPSNLILRPDGTTVLIDFTAATVTGEHADDTHTELTPGYAAPEQYERGGREGPWTDIYALGALGYRMATGQPPPDAPRRCQGIATPSARSAARGRYSETLLDAIDSALQLDASTRPQSAQAFRAMLIPPQTRITPPEAVDNAPTLRVERLASVRPIPVIPAAQMQIESTSGSPGRPRIWLRRAAQMLAVAVVAAGVFLTWRPAGPEFKELWIVDPAGQGDATTIAEALHDAPDGATISVLPGAYNETLVIDRPAFIVGADRANRPRILPAAGPCIVATASYGLVSGLEFGQGNAPRGACIVLSGSSIAVEDNVIHGRSGPAIDVRGEARPFIRNNRLTAIEGAGIVVGAGASGFILANELTDTTLPAIVVTDGAHPVISRNTISGTAQAGVLFERGSAGLLLENDILSSQASGIEIRGTAGPTIRNNVVQAGRQAGIYAYDGAVGRIVDNAITDNTYSGIVLDGASPTVLGNEIQDNAEHGILIVNTSKGQVRDNTITGNGGHGIAVSLGTEPELEGNTLSENQDPQTQFGIMSGG